MSEDPDVEDFIKEMELEKALEDADGLRKSKTHQKESPSPTPTPAPAQSPQVTAVSSLAAEEAPLRSRTNSEILIDDVERMIKRRQRNEMKKQPVVVSNE